jgi:hypothetical protein
VFGLIALAFGSVNVVVLLAVIVLRWMGHGPGDPLNNALGWFVFDYGFALDLVGFAMAVLAIVYGGRGRWIGVAAIVLVVGGFGLLFVS